MLIYTHNHIPGTLLRQYSSYRNEKQNSKSFFNDDANLTLVITMELNFIFFFFVMLVSLYGVISCDVILPWNFEILLLNSGYAPGGIKYFRCLLHDNILWNYLSALQGIPNLEQFMQLQKIQQISMSRCQFENNIKLGIGQNRKLRFSKFQILTVVVI